MGMGYMGYAKIGGNTVLITGSSVNLIYEPFYSDAVRGAGWYHASRSKSVPDITRYEGSIDLDLQQVIWSSLIDWVVEKRNKAKTLILSPDGLDVQTFTADDEMNGAWCTSANFSTSEGNLVTCSLGVLAVARTESISGSYMSKTNGLGGCTTTKPLNYQSLNHNPIPFWKTSAVLTVSGVSPFSDAEAIEWNIDVEQGLTVVYGCDKVRAPIAIFSGEMEPSGSVVMHSPNGVEPISGSEYTNTIFTVTLAGVGVMTLPKVVLRQDSYNVAGGDTVINRSFEMRGLGGDTPPFTMT